MLGLEQDMRCAGGGKSEGLTITITKSNQHQAFEKYHLKPYANHFKNISTRKMIVKNLST